MIDQKPTGFGNVRLPPRWSNLSGIAGPVIYHGGRVDILVVVLYVVVGKEFFVTTITNKLLDDLFDKGSL